MTIQSNEESLQTSPTPLGREDLARLVAKGIAPGSFMNLKSASPPWCPTI